MTGDAADRLTLDLAGADVAAAAPATVAVIGDRDGALVSGALAAGATAVRVHQDSLLAERALHGPGFSRHPLGPGLLAAATVVLMDLPRSLDELDEIAWHIAASADPSVVVYAGGRIKHMTLEMNTVLGRHFGSVQPSLGRQKSRVLVARLPRVAEPRLPARELHDDLGLWVVAHGGVFAGTKIDIGTRAMLAVLGGAMPDARTVIDLGCGSGILAAAVAKARPGVRVIATDESAAAVDSAAQTAAANGLEIVTVRDVGLESQPDASADLVLLNPPFHRGAAVDDSLAAPLFADAARVLRPGGELWTVYNSHLSYRASLQRIVGPTREVTRTTKFTVTASVRKQ